MIPIKQFNSLLNYSQKKGVIFLLFLILIGMFLETLGVGLVIPIFTIIIDPNIANKYPEAAMLLSKLSPLNWFFEQTETISVQMQLITGAIIVIIFVYSIKACFLVFLSWRHCAFTADLTIAWSKKLFTGYLNQPYSFHLQKNSAYLIRNVNNTAITASALESALILATEILVVLGIAALLIITSLLD